MSTDFKKFFSGFRFLSVSADAKTVKGEKKGYLTAILYLQPATLSGKNLCAHASAGCKAACLFSAGRGKFSSVQKGRARKTALFLEDRAFFLAALKREIELFRKLSVALGFLPAVRLNGTSDLPWHNLIAMGDFPDVQFYDYTKDSGRMARFLAGELPANYHLTFSRSEEPANQFFAEKWVLPRGGNVAAVFRLPKNQTRSQLSRLTEWNGHKVVSGDESDLRFLDPRGAIVALVEKGRAKQDATGFAITLESKDLNPVSA
jgi:hypothetical protein